MGTAIQGIIIPATGNTIRIDPKFDVGRPGPRRPRHLECAVVPVILFGGNLMGGASTPISAAVMTVAVSFAAIWSLLGSNVGMTRTYVKRLLWLIAPFVSLIAVALFTVRPESAFLQQVEVYSDLGIQTLSIDPSATWVEIMKFGGLAAAFIAARTAGADRLRLKAAATAMLVLGVIWALWALLLYVGDLGQAGLHRLAAPFVSPNVAAANLGVTMLCGFAALEGRLHLAKDRAATALFLATAGLVLLSCLVLTASRSTIAIMGGMGAIALAGKGLSAATGTDRRTFWTLFSAATLCVVMASLYAVTDLLPRFARLGPDAVDRLSIVATYAEAARHSPWFGYGFGSVPRLSRLLLTPENDASFWNIRAVHNLPVQWWVEAGVVGATLALTTLIAIFGLSLRNLSGTRLQRLAPLLLVSVLFLAQGMVDYAAQIYSMSLTWAFVLGLVFSASAAGRRRQRTTQHGPVLTGGSL
jgi:O-antigen ligase